MKYFFCTKWSCFASKTLCRLCWWDNFKEIVSKATACKRASGKEQSSFVSTLRFSWNPVFPLYYIASIICGKTDNLSARLCILKREQIRNLSSCSPLLAPRPQSPWNSFIANDTWDKRAEISFLIKLEYSWNMLDQPPQLLPAQMSQQLTLLYCQFLRSNSWAHLQAFINNPKHSWNALLYNQISPALFFKCGLLLWPIPIQQSYS